MYKIFRSIFLKLLGEYKNMALNLNKKIAIVSKINKFNNLAISVIVSDMTGVEVNKLTELRKLAKEVNVVVCSVRNSLLKRSIKNTKFECLKSELKGPTLVAYSMDHPGSAARLLDNFKKKNSSLKIKGAVFKEKLLSSLEIKALSEMPTYIEAIEKIIVILREISIGKLFRILSAIRQKKETNK